MGLHVAEGEAGPVSRFAVPDLGGGVCHVELAGQWMVSADDRLPAGLWTASVAGVPAVLSVARLTSTTSARSVSDHGPHIGLRWQSGLPDGDLLIGTLHTQEPFTRPARTVWTNLLASPAPDGSGPCLDKLSFGSGPHWIDSGELVQDGDAPVWLGVAAASSSHGPGDGRGAVLVSLAADPDGRWTSSSRPLLAPEEGWLKDWAISVVTRRAYLAVVTPRSPGVNVLSPADRLLAVDLDDGSVDALDLDLAGLGMRSLAVSPQGDQLAVVRLWPPDLDPVARPEPWALLGGGVLLLDLVSGEQRSLSRSGGWGPWRPGGPEVAVLADGRRTLRLVDLEDPDGSWLVRVEQAGETSDEADRTELWSPCWSPDGRRLAVSLVDGRPSTPSPTLVLDLATRTFVVVTTRGGLCAWTSATP